jgi:outer membrane protein TolC
MKLNKFLARVSLAFLFVSGSTSLMAQDTKTLTLSEAIDLTVKNSKQLKVSRAKLDEATAAVREAKDHKLPNVSISGSYLRVNSPNVSLKTEKDPNSGGGTASSTPDVSQAAYGIANVTLPVYQGLRIRYGIESAKFLERAASLDADNDQEEIVLNAINAFTNLYKAKAAVNIVKENLQQSRQRVNDFTNLEKNGLLARNDLLKAQLQTSNAELTLLDAENNWKLASVNMALMLGLPEQTVITPDSASLVAPGAIKTLDEYEQASFQHRKDIAALSLRRQAAAFGTKSVKGEMMPSVNVTGGYVALDIPKFVTVTNAVNLGVGVSYSLSSLWKTNAKLQQSKAREVQIKANEEQLNDAVRLEMNQAYQNYLLSLKKIDVYLKAIEQAEENYKITKNKYDNSLVTTTDLLDADVAQLQAKLNYTFSKADAIVAYNQILKSAGLLTSEPATK